MACSVTTSRDGMPRPRSEYLTGVFSGGDPTARPAATRNAALITKTHPPRWVSGVGLRASGQQDDVLTGQLPGGG
jgi:hypothetical protein